MSQKVRYVGATGGITRPERKTAGACLIRAMPPNPDAGIHPPKVPTNLIHVGALAHSLLTAGQSGRTLAAISETIYLQCASGEVLWLACGTAPLHRRCMKVPAPLPRIAQGTPFRAQSQRLEMDSGLILDGTGASLWLAPGVARSQAVACSEIPGRVSALACDLDLSQARGLACFIPDLLCCGPSSAAVSDPAMAQARRLVLDTARACSSHDRQRLARGAEALIGFGWGLTPSGDDFWGGLLFGIHALAEVYPGLSLPETAAIVEPYRLRTNPISFTLLDDLARGHGIEPVHRIVKGILEGQSSNQVRGAIQQLTQVGHSTGWDVLAGLLVSLSSAAGCT